MGHYIKDRLPRSRHQTYSLELSCRASLLRPLSSSVRRELASKPSPVTMSFAEMENQVIYHIDPSLEYRPENSPTQYRNYTINAVS